MLLADRGKSTILPREQEIDDEKDHKGIKLIIKADISDLHIPSSVPPETMDFISKMLKKIPEERMSAEEALTHPLISKYN